MGFSPAANRTTSGALTHLGQIHYKRVGLDQLMKKFVFNMLGEPDILPQREGKTVQWYRYDLLSANTSPASEGAPGEPIELATTTVSGTVSEYGDYTNVSSLLEETAIDPVVENASRQLGYRAGLSLDTIVRTELDSADASTVVAMLGGSLAAADLRELKILLEGGDVEPKNGEDFFGVIHPYLIYDLMADNTAGGFVDRVKYAQPTTFMTGEVGKVEGIRIMKSTNVQTSGTAPDVLYSSYVVGRGAMGLVDLAGRGPTKVQNPKTQSFSIRVVRNRGDQLADPTGSISAAVAYRFVFLAKLLDVVNYRFRKKQTNASII